MGAKHKLEYLLKNSLSNHEFKKAERLIGKTCSAASSQSINKFIGEFNEEFDEQLSSKVKTVGIKDGEYGEGFHRNVDQAKSEIFYEIRRLIGEE